MSQVAAATASSRFALQWLARHVRAATTVAGGAVLASAGTTIAAAASGPALALPGPSLWVTTRA